LVLGIKQLDARDVVPRVIKDSGFPDWSAVCIPAILSHELVVGGQLRSGAVSHHKVELPLVVVDARQVHVVL